MILRGAFQPVIFYGSMNSLLGILCRDKSWIIVSPFQLRIFCVSVTSISREVSTSSTLSQVRIPHFNQFPLQSFY